MAAASSLGKATSFFSPAPEPGRAHSPVRKKEKTARKIWDASIFSCAHSWRKSHPIGHNTLLQAAPMLGVLLDISASLDEVATEVEDEVVIESGLHVSGIAAASCYAKYGNPFTHGAPPLDIDWVNDDEALGPAKGETGKNALTDEELDLAVCLATPMEPNDESADVRVRGILKDLARELLNAEEDEEIVEELEEAEEAIITRGSKITRVRRRRGNEWVSEQEGMSQRPGTDEVNNICNIGLDQNRNSLIRSQPVQNPAEKTSGDLDTIDT